MVRSTSSVTRKGHRLPPWSRRPFPTGSPGWSHESGCAGLRRRRCRVRVRAPRGDCSTESGCTPRSHPDRSAASPRSQAVHGARALGSRLRRGSAGRYLPLLVDHAPPATRIVARLLADRTAAAGDPAIRTTQDALLPDLARIDLFDSVPSLEVPVSVFVGRHDRVAPPELTHRYFDALRASRGKTLVWFDGSAHMPQYEESTAFRAALDTAFDGFRRAIDERSQQDLGRRVGKAPRRSGEPRTS